MTFKIQQSEVLTKSIQVKLTQDENDRVRAMAKNYNTSPYEMCRQMVVHCLEEMETNQDKEGQNATV